MSATVHEPGALAGLTVAELGDRLHAQLDDVMHTIDAVHARGLHIPSIAAQSLAGLRIVERVLIGQAHVAPTLEEYSALDRLREQFGKPASS